MIMRRFISILLPIIRRLRRGTIINAPIAMRLMGGKYIVGCGDNIALGRALSCISKLGYLVKSRTVKSSGTTYVEYIV